jgi:signal transduction histidine kinase
MKPSKDKPTSKNYMGLERVLLLTMVLVASAFLVVSVGLYESIQNARFRSVERLVESIYQVSFESLVTRDEISIQKVLKSFHAPGQFVRISFADGTVVYNPRELFSPIWDSPPYYTRLVALNDSTQAIKFEVWTAPKSESEFGSIVLLIVASGTFATAVILLVSYIRSWKRDISRLNQAMDNPLDHQVVLFDFPFFQNLAQQIQEKEIERRKREAIENMAIRDGEIARMASQVAHDIRSPLAALNAILPTLTSLDDEQKHLIQSATHRIRDIAKNLLEKNRTALSQGELKIQTPKIDGLIRVSAVIDSIVSEKKAQGDSRVALGFSSPEVTELFARVCPTELGRVISNLIDNGVESLGEHGQVSVGLRTDEKKIFVSVTDNGKGIPEELIPMLTARGATFGKPNGTGLGLYHAKLNAAQWGGDLVIRSTIGKGTTVELSIPKSTKPTWQVRSLHVKKNHPIIVLDDDPSIHEAWKRRIISVTGRNFGVPILSFFNPLELQRWLDANSHYSMDAQFLMDYELGDSATGISTAERLKICSRTILVTSHADEDTIQRNCERLGMRLLPKGDIGSVNIIVEQEKDELNLTG